MHFFQLWKNIVSIKLDTELMLHRSHEPLKIRVDMVINKNIFVKIKKIKFVMYEKNAIELFFLWSNTYIKFIV